MRLKQHIFFCFFPRRRHYGAFIPEPAAPASCHPAAAPGTVCPQSSAGEERRGSSSLVTQITKLFIIIITRRCDIKWSRLPGNAFATLGSTAHKKGWMCLEKTFYVCAFENKQRSEKGFFFFFLFLNKRLHIQHVLGKALKLWRCWRQQNHCLKDLLP